jgi:hypothetical protein
MTLSDDEHMSHVGVRLDHPSNAAAIAYQTRQPSGEERRDAIRNLELALAKRHSPTLAHSLQRLRSHAPDPPITPSQGPEGANLMSLGALPEIVDQLWKVGRALPTDCRWIAYRRAVLAHSETGIIFGLAVGTFGIALRLPVSAEAMAQALGATQSLNYRAGVTGKTITALELGPDWWFCQRVADVQSLALAGYEYFGAL